VHYYEELFSTAGVNNLDTCLSAVTSRVSHAMNEMLIAPFSSKEVNLQALAQMHPLKAPGPDGFGVCFYQKH